MMVTAIVIIEMLGRPPEHLTQMLQSHIEKFEAQKQVTVEKKVFSEPKMFDEKTGLYTMFCEIEFTCPSLMDLMNIIFDYMPSSVEIIEPATINYRSDEATALMNNLSGRLHRYDDVVKVMRNREKKFIQEINLAKKILLDHEIIDSKGKVIKSPQGKMEKEDEDSNKESVNEKKEFQKKKPVKKKSTKKKK